MGVAWYARSFPTRGRGGWRARLVHKYMDRMSALGGSWLSKRIDGSDALGDDGDYQGLITHNPRPERRALRVAWRAACEHQHCALEIQNAAMDRPVEWLKTQEEEGPMEKKEEKPEGGAGKVLISCNSCIAEAWRDYKMHNLDFQVKIRKMLKHKNGMGHGVLIIKGY
ncbi:hypothetical protein OIU85_011487 [Salix viminalis]|uniref:Uncharacterized protein n=1 Tax=Salix viminalis TaxID=40686 RepID=A0A9Q0NSW7_SALVM|nr:hypothetical protein OIU85_011487 [Salix viminalis]